MLSDAALLDRDNGMLVLPSIMTLCACRYGGMVRFTCHDLHTVYVFIPCDLVASNILLSACALAQVCQPGCLVMRWPALCWMILVDVYTVL